ncbi:hypothetical protein RDE2_45620 [Rhodococcus sp. RDE2]|nr:hypothetical protein RDE2_45620 [Rhodococcus sp. RDE2]
MVPTKLARATRIGEVFVAEVGAVVTVWFPRCEGRGRLALRTMLGARRSWPRLSSEIRRDVEEGHRRKGPSNWNARRLVAKLLQREW